MREHRTAELWLKNGRASRLTATVSDALDRHVSSLPWAGTTGLDWSKMPPSVELTAARQSPEAILQWVETTRIAHHAHAAIWYSKREGGIVVRYREGILALDELYRHAPGPRFVFGVDVADGVVQPALLDLLQYGHGDLLVATA